MNNPEVEALRKVDQLDQKAIKLKREIREVPETLEKHRAAARKAAERVQACHDEQKKCQKEIDKLDLDTKANPDQVKKYQSQQNTVKTNEEYSTLKKQIEAIKKTNGDLEDKALGFYEKIDQLKAEEKATKETTKQLEAKVKEEEGLVAKD